MTREIREPIIEDAELFTHSIAGDNAAFLALFAKYNGKLERYVRNQLGASGPFQDVVQELWERVIALRSKPPRDVETKPLYVQAFLFRIARNLVIDHVRAHKEYSGLSELEDKYHPRTVEREPSDPEELVSRALEMLPLDHREVLTLHLFLGYRLDEIAELLGKSPDAIWARASRARGKLRRIVVELAEKEGISLKHYISEKA